jgi:nucleoside-diphosphate kinase
MERTLILVKPDAFARNLTGEIIARFERKGLRLSGCKQMTMSRELAEQHYAEHAGKGFYDRWSRWCSKPSRRWSRPVR